MKKKIFAGVAVLAVTIVVAWNVNISSKANETLNVSLANVEANAECEITKGNSVKLRCSGANTCSTPYLGYTLTCDGTKN